ncbi:SanA/YdcF family protein [Blattabacterium cuenoti]|uniref:SanA/YdcF family protein n=1 Tax=Blattabacterium cuenoti TaxID=1653831 RepID=UPI00163C1C18|nr:ElyC/SanA/YdcF family protein [Blattabacterium cuenoti]
MCIFFIIISIVIFSYFLISFTSRNKNYDSIEKIPYNNFGIVLGTSKYLHGGGVNYYFKSRMDAIQLLFYKKKIQYIIVSGDNKEENYNEPKMMKIELIKRGIPSNIIYEDLYGINTMNSIIRAYKIFHQKKFTIVSQKFHNERAIFFGKYLGLDVVAFNAKNLTTYSSKIYFREIFSRIKIFLRIFFHLELYKKFLKIFSLLQFFVSISNKNG